MTYLAATGLPMSVDSAERCASGLTMGARSRPYLALGLVQAWPAEIPQLVEMEDHHSKLSAISSRESLCSHWPALHISAHACLHNP